MATITPPIGRRLQRNERAGSTAALPHLAQSLRIRHRPVRDRSGVALPVHSPVFVNRIDYFVLVATILAIPLYGLWRTRGHPSLGQYLKGDASIRWGTIGLSVLARSEERRVGKECRSQW